MRKLTLPTEQVNAAKGRLKTILHGDLYNPIDRLLKFTTCAEKKEVLYDYEQGLSKTGAWPVETSFQSMSVKRMLTALGKYNATNAHATVHFAGLSHFGCSFSFKQTVDEAVKKTTIYFDGLCLGMCGLSSAHENVR